MLVLLSPAKSLDLDSSLPNLPFSSSRFPDETDQLVSLLRTKKSEDLAELMSLSPKLSQLNFERFQNFQSAHTLDNSRPALLTFTGDVYQGLNAPELTADELERADQKVRILSGLYGLLKPLDLMQPYRLEMGTKLAGPHGKNLYDFWAEKVSKMVMADRDQGGSDVLVNLASQEYAKAAQLSRVGGRVVTPVFKDEKNGQMKIISFYAKKARGLMTRFIVENDLTSVDSLKDFKSEGYRFSSASSSQNELVFERSEKSRE